MGLGYMGNRKENNMLEFCQIKNKFKKLQEKYTMFGPLKKNLNDNQEKCVAFLSYKKTLKKIRKIYQI